MQRIEIIEYPHYCLYICLLKKRYLMEMQYKLVLSGFHIVYTRIYLLLEMLMPKMLVPGVPKVLIPEVFIPKVAMPEVLVPLSIQKYICNLFKF